MPFDRILFAANFASEKHRNQNRKDIHQTPYINHPISVANVLVNEGGVDNEDLIIAALLHDTIEDTETSAGEIEDLFGAAVLKIVKEVTDDKSLEKAERKRLQIETAPHKSDLAKQLKLADKVCNIRDLTSDSPVNWPNERKLEYIQWAEKVVAGCKGINQRLDDIVDAEIAAGRQRLA